MSLPKREFFFEIKEVKSKEDPIGNRVDYLIENSGFVTVYNDDEIEVHVDDKQQEHNLFESKDNLFNRIMKVITKETY